MTDRELMQQALDALVYGLGISQDGKRIDPASIYKQPEPEPCNWVVDESAEGNLTMSWMLALPMPVGTKLYTAPPQREWQGLTDEEIQWCYEEGNPLRAIEAKLREKNT